MKINKVQKVSINIVLLMLLTLALAVGCVDKEKTQEHATSSSALKANSNAKVDTIIDQNGKEIIIPKDINRVIMVPLPLPALYYVVTGSCRKIAGIHPESKSNAKVSMLGVFAPELMNVATGFVKGKDLNIEELLKLRPDIIFFWGLFPKQAEQFESIDIPAVAVHTVKGGNALETLHLWINILGETFDEKERTLQLVDYNRETMKMISSRIRDIALDKKPRALLLFYHSDKQICSGKGNYSQFWLESTGAINVAESIPGISALNMEQIYKWNPDIIYISNFSNTLPEDILNNTVKGQDWSKVRAVKEKRVYKIPSGIYRWVPPSADASLMLKWLAQKHYPKLFNDYTIEEEIKHHYLRFYNYSLSQKQIVKILHPVHSTERGPWT
ncbi:MAG: ABC transporter substrate-binding protein [Proteobacteria bacterium]|nr:ABC transporter substrate-binding protein [Pseudomonadota bacterium]